MGTKGKTLPGKKADGVCGKLFGRLRQRDVMILLALMAAGTVLRALACFWGYPYRLHPDEPYVVNSTIDMLSRHSYEANTFYRPDHFEIKCCAVLFQIVSYLLYHVSAPAAFAEHAMVFHVVARLYTTVFGAVMIVLAYKFVALIKDEAKLLAAALFAFFPILVQHSALATPDIVLAAFVLFISYCSLLYMQDGKKKHLTAACIAIGLGITVKYTCAIACIWIAFIVCRDCVKRKKYLDIIKLGVYCVVLVFGVCFLAAPNLFTNLPATIDALIFGNHAHAGADGLSFAGNFLFYINTFLKAAGYETAILMVIGLLFCVKAKSTGAMSLGMGLLFWVCTSVLKLHWDRWGMQIYPYFLILAALGISYLIDLAKAKWQRGVVYALSLVTVCNCVSSGVLTVQNALTKDARVAALEFCEQEGITAAETLYNGYTPFNMSGPADISVQFDEMDAGGGYMFRPAFSI